MKAMSITQGRQVEALVRQHQASVRGYLTFLGCPPDRLDDVLQDVFLSVLAAGFEDRGERSTAAYLRTVARNLFLKSLRGERRLQPLGDLDEVDCAWEEFEGDDGGQSYLSALRDCLRGVRGRAADALALRYQKGLRLLAIAERMELTEAGVKSILVRTKKRLRGCIERRLA